MKSFALCITLLSLLSSSLAFVVPHHARVAKHQRRALEDNLFPSGNTYKNGFTTAAGITVPGVTKLPLADGPLNVIQVQSGMTHKVVQQAGKTAWEAVYPKGSFKPSANPLGGFGFYVGGSDAFNAAIKNGAKEVVVGYSVMFEEGFEFNKGGKLPGGFGGVGESAFGCSGGRQEGRSECFDGRIMWRRQGAGELYTYLPLTKANEKAMLSIEGTIKNPDFGFSVGRGAFSFPAGEWVTVVQRIKLNDPGARNGEMKVWVNGEVAIDLQDVQLREGTDSVFHGMHFQTFFGGGSSDWASPKTQKAWFADVSGAVVA